MITAAITAIKEPLAEARQIAIKTWLAKPEFNMVMGVIKAKMQVHGTAALDNALQAKDHELKFVAANDDLQKAHRYAICLEVLNELATQQEPFTTAKLS